MIMVIRFKINSTKSNTYCIRVRVFLQKHELKRTVYVFHIRVIPIHPNVYFSMTMKATCQASLDGSPVKI